MFICQRHRPLVGGCSGGGRHDPQFQPVWRAGQAASQVFPSGDFGFLCMGMGSAKGLVGGTYNVCYSGHLMSLL